MNFNMKELDVIARVIAIPEERTRYNATSFAAPQTVADYLSRPCRRPFPSHNDIGYQQTIEAQGPLVTANGGGAFSGCGLTDWYVGAFIELSHLAGVSA